MTFKTPPSHILTAAVSVLGPYVPELSATALVTALRDHDPNAGPQADRWLDKHEAAKMLGVSWFTLNSWARDGKIKAQKIGSQWRFRLSDVQAGGRP